MKTSTKVLEINNQNDFLDVITNGARFRIYLLDENIIRIRGLLRMILRLNNLTRW